jgi:hypothetical protein
MSEEKENGGKLATTEKEKQLDKPVSFQVPESIDDIDIQDIRLSNLFICQDQSKARDKDVQPGMLYDNQTFESYPSLKVIMFFKFNSRILYGAKPGDPVRCFSSDGKIPSMHPSINPDCISCHENIRQAHTIKKGESKYGACNRTFNFGCILPNVEEGSEKDFPFLISMQRMNMPTAKKIVNMLFRKRQELFFIERQIETEQITNDKGRFYIFKITDLEAVSENDIHRSKYWLQFLKEMMKAQRLIINYDDEEKNITPNNSDSDIPF